MTRGSETEESPFPRLRPGFDLTKLGLSFDEGNIAMRCDGRSSIAEIASAIGKSKPEVERLLERLIRASIVQIGDPPEPQDAVPSTADLTDEEGKLDYGKFIFPLALMQEECDLNEDERKRIFWFYDHLQKWSFYELLQVRRRDDAKEVKRAYFLRSKEWHPDRFRRPRLGSFRRMIDEIYRRIKEAHEVLSDAAARERYDETVVFNPDAEEMAEMLDQQRRIERDKRREQEMIDRRRRRNPIRKRAENARVFYQQALQKEEAGELLTALRLAQTAAAFDPRPEYDEAVERLKVSAGEHRVGPYMRRGMHQESMLQWDDAIKTYEEAVRMAPEHGTIRLRLAYNMLMGRRDPHETKVHAAKAAQLLPEDAEAHFVLGMCYEKGGMEKAAVREYSRALELKPNYAEAKKRLKKLKWGFLGG